MANELNIQLDPFNETGLVLLGKVFDKNGTQQGTSVTLTENSSALYSGNFNLSSISDDAYLVRFETNLPDELYGTGVLYVRNNTEVSQENFFNATFDEVVTNIASRDASKADVSGIETKIEADARQVTLISEHNQTQTDISNLNNISASDVYTEFTTGTNEDAFKADVSGLSTFDPSTQDVNTNNLSREASKADVSNLATQSSVDDVPVNVDTQLTVVHGSGSWQQGSSSGTVDANIISVDGNSVNGVNDFKADVSGLSTFDASSDDVTTDSASREASKADTTNLATKDNQEIINNGVKKSSLIIPHNEDTQ